MSRSADPPSAHLVVEGVAKSFDRPVLTGVDLDVAQGSVAAVLGPSGCGKTTLLRIVAGFLAADRGRARLGSLQLFDERRSLAPDRRGVGVVPQEGALFPHLNVANNVGFGLGRSPDRQARIDELLELVGLPDAARARPHELSGGQQQRVALARALAPRPALLLLDEPFSSLDAALRAHVREEIGRMLRQAGCTAVLVTHDQDEALSLADQVAVLLDGEIVQAGPPRELYERPATLAVAMFVGEAVQLPGDVRRGVARTALGRHRLVAKVTDGSVTVLIRPERIRVAPSGVRAVVVEYRYFGADAMVRSRLETGDEVVHRVSPETALEAGAEVCLEVVGEVLAYPRA